MKKILFVCSGNTCRSPMAVSIFENIINKNKSKNQFIINSAGISAKSNQPMNENAVKALKNFKIPVLNHCSVLLNEKDIIDNDIVITMTTEQKEFLSNYKNVFSLKEISGGEDILDPFGENFDFYLNVCQNLINSLNIVYKKLVEKNDIFSK